MRVFPAMVIAVALAVTLPSCVIYRTYDREVRVWNERSGEPAQHGEFRYGHATPVPHFPRNPEPVVVSLNEKGRAMVSIPGALGWIGYGEDSTLIEGSQIREGGTFGLFTPPSSEGNQEVSAWKVTISKPPR